MTNKETENKVAENKVTRKPNGKPVAKKAPAKTEEKAPKPVEKKAEVKKVEKAPKAEKAPKVEKIPAVPKLSRREAIMAQVKLSGKAAWETTETARNKENSAMVINDGAIMLTNITDKGAKRFLEIYLRARTNDAILLVTKANFLDAIDTAREGTAEQKKARAAFAEKYEKAVQPPKKGSKLVLPLANDTEVVNFATAFMLAM